MRDPSTSRSNGLSRHWFGLGTLLVLFVASTLPFLTQHPFHWDGAQFVLGVHDYSVILHQPHPPGYPLFVGAAKLFSFFLDPYPALQLEAALFALAAVIAVYFLGVEVWRSRLAGWIAGICLLFNPLFWFYRETGLTYVVDAFAATLLALLVLKSWDKRPSFLLWGALFLGLVSGFRPSLALLLLPLLLGVAWRLGSMRLVAKASAIWLLCLLAWAAPMFSLEGLSPTFEAIAGQFSRAGGSATESCFFSTRWGETKRLISNLAGSLSLLWLAAVVGLAGEVRHPDSRLRRRFLVIAALWAVPPLLFFALVHFGQLGYLLVVTPLLCLFAAAPTRAVARLSRGRALALWLVLAATLGSNLLLFSADLTPYLDPGFSSSRAGARKIARIAHKFPSLFGLNRHVLTESDRRISAFLGCIQRFSPDEVLVISSPNSSGSRRSYWPVPIDDVYRNLGAMLPDYRILVPSAEAGAVFETHRYRTMVQRSKDFELPSSVEYMVVTVDSIPEACSPAGIEFRQLDLQGQSCFVGKVKSSFSYCGIRFIVPDP